MSKTQLSHSDIVPSKLQRGRPRKFRSGSNSEVELVDVDFRFTPESGLNSDIAPCPFRANNGSRQFSITSFAWGEQFAGTLRQIALRNQYMHADEIKIVNIST